MESLHDIVKRQQQARPSHDDPLVERLLAEIVRLGEELCVARDRVDSCIKLAATGVRVDEAAIDAYEPSEEEIAERLERHRRFFEALMARLGDGDAT
ncbi:MAG: hypothetical protein R3288_02740 [Woeseiaceae bacterium]|nr:hypothetical protein [Woeseiaceae bacterium]